ncbi:hypothetical protein ABI_20840 [Asticcacaulis biprosthecium C19]|uniref:HEAT repeat domain-containing protein n=1 Tax=Asticcacaulis biprosthecium C19 TaxID=715226 RepID=F4QGG2_9CAUL|nr:HEAT repeat domain-containing protein [Asticcacaulis biprosthecium]EGF93643.1 hypothetical protein ABI_20840 [Asticcacaulis biprosthecium C19]
MVAQRALAEILGETELKAAVDAYVAGDRGADTARSVLMLIRPSFTIDYCHEIYLSSQDEDEKSMAVNLLKAIGDARVLAWIPLYLSDANAAVRAWGIGILEELYYRDEVESEAYEAVLRLALAHPENYIREAAVALQTEMYPK